MRGLAGNYSEAQLGTIRGEISALVALVHEAAVRQWVKPVFQATALDQISLHVGGPEVGIGNPPMWESPEGTNITKGLFLLAPNDLQP